MEAFKIIKSNEDWKQAITEGYTTLISGVDYNSLGDGYIACTWETLPEVFKEVSGHEYDQLDGTFGSASPINETFGNNELF
jgi:hypothetical protein